MRDFLLFLASFLPLVAIGADDTTWFDARWNKISRDKAVYYCTKPVRLLNGKYQSINYWVNGGTIESSTVYKDSLLSIADGPYTVYFPNGRKHAEGNYKNNMQNGLCKLYYEETGNVRFEGIYENGFFNGEVVRYYSNGRTERREKYRKGKLKSGACFTRTGNDTIYHADRSFPRFPGGDENYESYITQMDLYKQACKKWHSTKFFVHALFDETGKIYEAYIEGVIDPTEDQNTALLIIKSMPKWEPALNSDGIPIKSERDLDIQFK